MTRLTWAVTRLPLPMLALAASYGVYTFNALFVPHWVALVSAAAFELTYVALAVADTPDRRRATVIAISAVVVSVLYNTLAGLFHIRPALLTARPLWADVALAVLHGLPLAVVAYNVSVLLLHTHMAHPRQGTRGRRRLVRHLVAALRHERAAVAQAQQAVAQARHEAARLRQDVAQAQHTAAVRAPSDNEQTITYNGQRYTLAQLVEATGTSSGTLRRKLAQVAGTTAQAAD